MAAPTIAELRAAAKVSHDAALAIHNKAEGENRDLTPEEKTEYLAKLAETRSLDDRAARTEELATRAANPLKFAGQEKIGQELGLTLLTALPLDEKKNAVPVRTPSKSATRSLSASEITFDRLEAARDVVSPRPVRVVLVLSSKRASDGCRERHAARHGRQFVVRQTHGDASLGTGNEGFHGVSNACDAIFRHMSRCRCACRIALSRVSRSAYGIVCRSASSRMTTAIDRFLSPAHCCIQSARSTFIRSDTTVVGFFLGGRYANMVMSSMSV